MQLLLKGGRVVDPSSNLDKQADLLIKDGVISEIGDIAADESKYQIEDVAGKIVAPGLVDMHVHLREPGFEYKEDIESGSKAAAISGITSVACMPNTKPAIDNKSIVEFIREKAKSIGYAKVYPIGALTKDMISDEMAEIGDMLEGGAAAFSDDAFPIANSGLLRRIMEYCFMFDVPVITHCEDKSLSDDGLMNEGLLSDKMGLKGIPAESEEISVIRNIILAGLTGCKLHIAHVSTKKAVGYIREAKKSGIKVTCETCPHYFTLTENAVEGYNTNAKMNPPLRKQEDVDAVIEGLADGTIDAIATDHAPHSIEEKETEFAVAATGIIGMETSLPLTLSNLVKKDIIDISYMIKLMSLNPAKILGINAGTLGIGKPADIVVIDEDASLTVDPSKFKSKARNTPFAGMELQGQSVLTILNGKIVSKNGSII